MSGKSATISVNPDLCQGHNRCKVLAPTLFQLDQYGIASAAGDGSVPPDLLEKAKLAVANCPEFAITLTEK